MTDEHAPRPSHRWWAIAVIPPIFLLVFTLVVTRWTGMLGLIAGLFVGAAIAAGASVGVEWLVVWRRRRTNSIQRQDGFPGIASHSQR